LLVTFIFLIFKYKAIKVMTYSNKIKDSKNILEVLNTMKDNEDLTVEYGVGWKGKPNTYKIKCYVDTDSGVRSYSIWSSFSGMNVEKIGPTSMKCYTYDMMSQRTNYTFPLYEMKMISKDKDNG